MQGEEYALEYPHEEAGEKRMWTLRIVPSEGDGGSYFSEIVLNSGKEISVGVPSDEVVSKLEPVYV